MKLRLADWLVSPESGAAWTFAEQLTELGRRLAELGAEVTVPAIPALGIRAGLEIVTFDESDSGISVRGRRPS